MGLRSAGTIEKLVDLSPAELDRAFMLFKHYRQDGTKFTKYSIRVGTFSIYGSSEDELYRKLIVVLNKRRGKHVSGKA